MSRASHLFPIIVALALTAACDRQQPAEPGAAPAQSATRFSAQRFIDDIRVLASDGFGGRAPATAGEYQVIDYLERAFAAAGLVPGNDGRWHQPVPLVEIVADPDMTLTIIGDNFEAALARRAQMMAWTRRITSEVRLTGSDMVFVGYGIVAPEYGWDDYADIDVTGKTVVMLVNDPGYASRDPDLFNGYAMTRYGRWDYKFDEAARQGAAAAFIVHESGAAGYGWDVVANSWSQPQFELDLPREGAEAALVEGWLTRDSAENLLAQAGTGLAELEAAAGQRGFRARPLPLRAFINLQNRIRRLRSHNVIGVLPGAELPHQAVIYTAHWDHLGTDENATGDGIYNGARDNATGVAGLIELARAFGALAERPRRSIVFLAVTAEESGLLGSRYYSLRPTFRPRDIAANINIDGMNIFGPTRDVEVIGRGASELEDYLAAAAAAQNRVLVDDADPHKGYYYRSDHYSFARIGVPALYAESGNDHRERGIDYGRAAEARWRAEHYHAPSDEFSEDWDVRGALEDLELYFSVGLDVANAKRLPAWRPGNEFRAIRERSLATEE